MWEITLRYSDGEVETMQCADGHYTRLQMDSMRDFAFGRHELALHPGVRITGYSFRKL